jgi:DNA-binding HxlR family transcriptional regulator
VTTRTYGQYCPIAAALDVVGDRWNLLILRELSFGPQRFTDLRQALPGVAANLLTERLRDLEHAGLVQRDELEPPAARTVYVLTDEGRQVRPVLTALARFGAHRLPAPDDHTPIRPRAALAAAITAFHQPLAAADLDQHARVVIDGTPFDLRCHAGKVRRAPADSTPSLTLTASGSTLVQVRQGHRTLADAIARGDVVVDGSKRSLQQFARAFDLH